MTYTTYTDPYTAPFSSHPYTEATDLHAAPRSERQHPYTDPYTAYTRPDLHAGPPLFRGGPVVGIEEQMTHSASTAPASTGEIMTTSAVARAAALDRKVARFNLEELAAVGVVEHDHTEAEEDEHVGAVHWQLTGDEGAIISDVFACARTAGGWDETWVSIPQPPQRVGSTGV